MHDDKWFMYQLGLAHRDPIFLAYGGLSWLVDRLLFGAPAHRLCDLLNRQQNLRVARCLHNNGVSGA